MLMISCSSQFSEKEQKRSAIEKHSLCRLVLVVYWASLLFLEGTTGSAFDIDSFYLLCFICSDGILVSCTAFSTFDSLNENK